MTADVEFAFADVSDDSAGAPAVFLLPEDACFCREPEPPQAGSRDDLPMPILLILSGGVEVLEDDRHSSWTVAHSLTWTKRVGGGFEEVPFADARPLAPPLHRTSAHLC